MKKIQEIDRTKGHNIGKYYGTCYPAWEESRSAPEQLHVLDNLSMINGRKRGGQLPSFLPIAMNAKHKSGFHHLF